MTPSSQVDLLSDFSRPLARSSSTTSCAMDDEDADAVGAAPPPETTALVPVAGVSVQDADADKDPLLPPPPPQVPLSPVLSRFLSRSAVLMCVQRAWGVRRHRRRG